MAAWVEKLFEAQIPSNTLTRRAERMQQKITTNVVNQTTPQNTSQIPEKQENQEVSKENKPGPGRPLKYPAPPQCTDLDGISYGQADQLRALLSMYRRSRFIDHFRLMFNVNKNQDKIHPLVTAQELGQILSIKPPTLLAWARQGSIPHHRIESLVRFNLEEVAEWLKKKQYSPIKPILQVLKKGE
jgi:excisionase family DNA binding protein